MKDLTVFYRMCGIPSTNPSPWYQEDKFKLNQMCLKSFLMGYSDIKMDIHFLLDYCDDRYDGMIKELTDGTIEHTEIGINNTMLASYELARNEKGFVLFQECDYLYRPRVGRDLVVALERLDIVSPYDHLNFYIDRNIHSPQVTLDLVGDVHFRTTERNTMTWATHSDIVREYFDIFMKYGYLDDQVWFDLFVLGKYLWVPIPSFATHCVKDYLAPGVNWDQLWKVYQ